MTSAESGTSDRGKQVQTHPSLPGGALGATEEARVKRWSTEGARITVDLSLGEIRVSFDWTLFQQPNGLTDAGTGKSHNDASDVRS